MSDRIARTLEHLAALVAFDTRNPPRRIGVGGIFEYLTSNLRGLRLELTDHGDGAVSLLAIRGAPELLFNVHLDTVPASPGWTADPLTLRTTETHATALGACDIKGAAAALLTAAERTRGPAAFLFTSDEEGSDPRCIRAFLAKPHGFANVLVAEPTRGLAVLAHRGISSARAKFRGRAGHASERQIDSAVHHAMNFGARALDWFGTFDDARFESLTGTRFNIGRVEGGVKANVVAAEAELRFGFRPLPSQDFDELHARLVKLAPPGSLEVYEETFRGPALPCGPSAREHLERAKELTRVLGLPAGDAVDFWTEAALFSAQGITAIVFGPGDVGQAHAADESVSIEELDTVAKIYERLMS
ncbi:MAG: acetylornithine deacetylase [Deltaproteobacteria bacterium]|nr:acetylornithine deacetylase [Deltaproteobacteria bacterium]